MQLKCFVRRSTLRYVYFAVLSAVLSAVVLTKEEALAKEEAFTEVNVMVKRVCVGVSGKDVTQFKLHLETDWIAQSKFLMSNHIFLSFKYDTV
jgi:hypothetical protein